VQEGIISCTSNESKRVCFEAAGVVRLNALVQVFEMPNSESKKDKGNPDPCTTSDPEFLVLVALLPNLLLRLEHRRSPIEQVP
jgi:hypothetical protein